MFTSIYSLSLAIFVVVVGATKLIRPKQTLAAASGGAWASDFSASAIKGIGALELLAAFAFAGASLTGFPGIALAACSILAIVMTGAVITHVRRAEYKQSAFAAAVGIAVVGGILLMLPRVGH